jgi:hypothetical protein
MSKATLRYDKTCLNCGHVVEKRFCPNCGQENVQVRKNFYHLFVHFFEDLTHYENAFWRTIKNLITKPGALTNEYLSGKRMSYLAPIRLYIFISFVTFLSINLLPDESDIVKIDTTEQRKVGKNDLETAKKNAQSLVSTLEKENKIEKKEADSLKNFISSVTKKDDDISVGFFTDEAKSLEEYDEKIKNMPEGERPWKIEKMFVRKSIELNNRYSGKELQERFFETFKHNLPKALFIYMPFFALILWLFENKKKYYYFDHGIFTLHYFSFLLLITLFEHLLSWLFYITTLDDYTVVELLYLLLVMGSLIYSFYYFFPAHHRFYKTSRVATFFKGIIIFFINCIFIIITLSAMALYSFYNIK